MEAATTDASTSEASDDDDDNGTARKRPRITPVDFASWLLHCRGMSFVSESDTAEVMEHWRGKEKAMHSSTKKTRLLQDEVTPITRWILIERLFEACERSCRVFRETYFSAIGILDRFLSIQRVTREQLPCVGAACLWIASKYEETSQACVPGPSMCARLMDFAGSSREALVDMEMNILQALEFNLSMPSCMKFLECYWQTVKKEGTMLRDKLFATHLMELAMLGGEPSLSGSSPANDEVQILESQPGTPKLVVEAPQSCRSKLRKEGSSSWERWLEQETGMQGGKWQYGCLAEAPPSHIAAAAMLACRGGPLPTTANVMHPGDSRTEQLVALAMCEPADLSKLAEASCR